MDWKQAVFTIALANLIVLVPMLLTGHAGPKYGIPFPVFARASFGVRGANLPRCVRALVACGWFGIQTWIGGEAIYFLPASSSARLGRRRARSAATPGRMWLCFAIFWALERRHHLPGHGDASAGSRTGRRPSCSSAPRDAVVDGDKAGGFGPLLDQPSAARLGRRTSGSCSCRP